MYAHSSCRGQTATWLLQRKS